MRQIFTRVRHGLERQRFLYQTIAAKRTASISHNTFNLTGSNKLQTGFCKLGTGSHRLVTGSCSMTAYHRLVPVSRYTCTTVRTYSQFLCLNYFKSCVKNERSDSRYLPKRFYSSEDEYADEDVGECKLMDYRKNPISLEAPKNVVIILKFEQCRFAIQQCI